MRGTGGDSILSKGGGDVNTSPSLWCVTSAIWVIHSLAMEQTLVGALSVLWSTSSARASTGQVLHGPKFKCIQDVF